ncbi:hypothetical protein [Paenibacillus bouchesdurhonensis]|uniref:hypothetical protein n=1 Tax=Paenibacillus bouchesdurhonensis TaxID=1870990 RepID=UPI000DA61E32|nr:hypothetical protein [Paenibacillus bouchesdurhonensis]
MANNVLNQLAGQRFGKLTVIRRAEKNSKSGNAMWICECDCGNRSTVIGSHLRSGKTSSCGCNRISQRSMGHSKDRLYRTWLGMHNRCYNPDHDRYEWYGGKGISICDEWHVFMTFRNWALANGYTDELTIDRIDVDGNYSPGNCQWVDMKTQANNRSNNRILRYRGKRYTATELAEAHGLAPHTVFNRLKLGWTVDKIVNTPERCEG